MGLLDGRYFVFRLGKNQNQNTGNFISASIKKKKRLSNCYGLCPLKKMTKVLTSRTFDSTFFGNGAFAEVIK